MTLFEHIRRHFFEERLKRHGLLVVYDPTKKRLFRAVAEALAKKTNVVFLDAGTSALNARKQAGLAIRKGLKTKVVIYVPSRAPETDQERMLNPYAAFAEIGEIFPQQESDKYLQICLACYPKYEAEVRQAFVTAGGEPDFEIFDQLSQGKVNWPFLRAKSGKTSEEELLQWLLATASDQDIKEVEADVRDFARDMLGCNVEEVPPEQLTDRLWSAALLAELVTDFGDTVPRVLQSIALPPESYRLGVSHVLDSLRRDKDDHLYKSKADAVEVSYLLAKILPDSLFFPHCRTFRFEERRRMATVLNSLIAGNSAFAKELLPDKHNVWAAEELASSEWEVVKEAIHFHERIQAVKAGVNSSRGSLSSIIKAYAEDYSRMDTAARLFAEAVESHRSESAREGADEDANPFSSLESSLLRDYRDVSERLQKVFVTAVVNEGWPARDVTDNARFFDAMVAPLIQQEKGAVALIVVDGLRYEVGHALAEALGDSKPTLCAACARFPTITDVGKASLLPGASESALTVDVSNKTIVPVLNGKPLAGLLDRMDFLKCRYGNRFKEMTTATFLAKSKLDLGTVDLLYLRYDDLDAVLERGNEGRLQAVKQCINHLVRVVNRLKRLTSERFTDVVIATDHGFVLNFDTVSIDKCEMPLGEWVSTHDRFLLGKAVERDSANVIVEAAQLGIRANVPHVAFPAALCAYRAGKRYFHGGVSLPESVVPIIAFKLSQATKVKTLTGATFLLTTKNNKTKFNSLIARLTICQIASSLFEQVSQTKVRILAFKKGDEKRKAPVGVVMNNDSGIITLVGNEPEDFKIQFDEFADEQLDVVVQALEQDSSMLLAETNFTVEILK